MADTPLRKPRWYLIPVRILIVTFLVTLLSFALSLLLGIFGVILAAKIKGAHPNLTLAYRDVALPIAALVGTHEFRRSRSRRRQPTRYRQGGHFACHRGTSGVYAA